jgi:putative membrane protein
VIAAAPTLGDLLTRWELGPGVAVPALAAVVYVVAAGRAAWPPRRTLSFGAGCATLAVALGSGIAIDDDALVSVHMAQHILLTTFAAPLLVAAAPVTLLVRNLRRRPRRALASVLHSAPARVLTHPVVALVVFAAVLLGAHLPVVYEAAVAHPLLHAVEHAAFLWSAVLFWAPLVAVDPVPHRAGFMTRLAVLLATMPLMAAVSIPLNSASGVVYPSYRVASARLGVDALADQRAAAGVMTVLGMTGTAAVALLVLADALRQEERRARAREAYADLAERERRPG